MTRFCLETVAHHLAVMLNLFQHPRFDMSTGGVGAMKQPCVYILASGRNGTLYIGVTANLTARLHQHRSGSSGFANRYGVFRLVWYEFSADMPTAIAREKQLKRWHREWKLNLIERDNPDWADLAVTLGLEPIDMRSRHSGS